MHKQIKEQILESISVKELTLDSCLNDIGSAAEIMIASIRGGGKILWCGNGGSAGDAQHLATELMGGMTSHERKPIPSLALTTDTSFITAWSNDTDFESIFSRQIQALGKKGDILFSISSSGQSPNVLEAIKMANNLNLTTISLLGKLGGKALDISHKSIVIPSDSTARVQEMHLLVIHILCELIETQLGL